MLSSITRPAQSTPSRVLKQDSVCHGAILAGPLIYDLRWNESIVSLFVQGKIPPDENGEHAIQRYPQSARSPKQCVTIDRNVIEKEFVCESMTGEIMKMN